MVLDVYCHYGVVLLAGVVESGSTLGEQAVALARAVPGVKGVESYFLPERPSRASDLALLAKIKAKFIGDGDLQAPSAG